MRKFLGGFLMGIGLLLLGNSIAFAGGRRGVGWDDWLAGSAVLAVCGGLYLLVFQRGDLQALGWVLLVGAVLMVMASGHVILLPMTLTSFLIRLVPIALGAWLWQSDGRA